MDVSVIVIIIVISVYSVQMGFWLICWRIYVWKLHLVSNLNLLIIIVITISAIVVIAIEIIENY